MNNLKLLLITLFLIFGQIIFACDCESKDKFLKVSPKKELVTLVKIISYTNFENLYEEFEVPNNLTPMSMEVEIIEIFKGKEDQKTITIWGDNGILCRPYITEFKPNEYYLIALNKGLENSDFGQKNEKKSDYYISNCGEYWLKANVQKNFATGYITNRKLPFSKIRKRLK